MEYVLLRAPEMAKNQIFCVDAFHHSSHEKCSGFYSSRENLATKNLNAALNEQNNRKLNHIKTSAAFMGQVRFLMLQR